MQIEETHSAMIRELRMFLDALTSTGADDRLLRRLTAAMALWTARLRPRVPESDDWHAIRRNLPSRGRTICPPVTLHSLSPRSLAGTSYFGDHFLGKNGAAHGGAIASLFDEVLGEFVNRARPRSRTAYLHINYRSVTPINKPVQIKAELMREEGRKLFLTGSIICEDVICAQAEALFVKLKPGQP